MQRNDPCHCLSGKKYKKCCLSIDQACTIYEQDPYDIAFVAQIIPEVEDECERILEKLELDNDIIAAQEAISPLYHEYPNNYYVHFVRAICSFKEKKFTQAITQFEKVIQLNPCLPEAFYNLGQLYRREVKIPEFVACYKRILKIEPKNSALYLSAQHGLDELEQIIKETNGISLDQYIYGHKFFDKAFNHLHEKQYETAIALFEKVLSINPKHTQSFGNMGLAYSYLGKNKLAVECLDKALSIDPTYAPALINRETISMLQEGEKHTPEMETIHYYKSGMERILT